MKIVIECNPQVNTPDDVLSVDVEMATKKIYVINALTIILQKIQNEIQDSSKARLNTFVKEESEKEFAWAKKV